MNIKDISRYLRQIADDLEKEVNILDEELNWIELIKQLKEIDERYEDDCAMADENYGKSIGTSYNDYGFNGEFYIDSNNWHPISEIIRKIKI